MVIATVAHGLAAWIFVKVSGCGSGSSLLGNVAHSLFPSHSPTAITTPTHTPRRLHYTRQTRTRPSRP